MEWLLTDGSLHLERSLHPQLGSGDLGGGGGVRLSFRYIRYMCIVKLVFFALNFVAL